MLQTTPPVVAASFSFCWGSPVSLVSFPLGFTHVIYGASPLSLCARTKTCTGRSCGSRTRSCPAWEGSERQTPTWAWLTAKRTSSSQRCVFLCLHVCLYIHIFSRSRFYTAFALPYISNTRHRPSGTKTGPVSEHRFLPAPLFFVTPRLVASSFGFGFCLLTHHSPWLKITILMLVLREIIDNIFDNSSQVKSTAKHRRQHPAPIPTSWNHPPLVGIARFGSFAGRCRCGV